MSSQKLNTSEVRADQVASSKLPTLKLGLDVHAESIVVVRILDNRAPPPAQKFTPAKFLAWVKTQLSLAEQVHSCYEAGPFGYGLHRDLVALGVRNLVVQPVCLDEQHKGVNHDKSAAKQLALRLDRYVAGNAPALATVRVVVWQRECTLVKKWGHVFGNPKATKAAKKKAIVAMARQMAVDLWRWRTGRVKPTVFGWTMVGAPV